MYTFIGLLSHFETLKSILKNACKKKKFLSFLKQFSNSYLENCSSEPVKTTFNRIFFMYCCLETFRQHCMEFDLLNVVLRVLR